MRKFLSLLLAVLLIVPSVLVAAETALPLTNEEVTLTCFMMTDVKWSATKNSVAEVGSYQVIMDKTKVNIKFIHPAAGQETEQFNLMIASNQLPDMIFYNWASVTGGPAKYLEDFVIIPLNEPMQKWAPNFMKYMEKYPEARKQSVLDDGTFYMFPMLRINTDNQGGEWFRVGGPMIRQDWLDKVGMAMPTTKDELYNVLTAFRDKDPNGNGKQDEIPYAVQSSTGLTALAPMFKTLYDFQLKDGKVTFGPVLPEFREFVETMRQWYAEGLIDKEYSLTDGAALTAKMTGDQAGSTFNYLAGGMGTWTNMMNGKGGFNLVAMPWTKFFWKKAKQRMTGSTKMVAAAISLDHSTEYWLINCCKPKERVFFSGLVM